MLLRSSFSSTASSSRANSTPPIAIGRNLLLTRQLDLALFHPNLTVDSRNLTAILYAQCLRKFTRQIQ